MLLAQAAIQSEGVREPGAEMIWLPLIILLAFILLVVHCYKTRGKFFTLKIFGGGMAIFVAKEIQNQLNQPQRYEAGEAAFNFLGVPWAVVMGWIFAIYIGWVMAEKILRKLSPKRYGSVFPTIAITSMVVFTISLAMEVTGTQMRWWIWTAERANAFRPLFLGLPLLVPLEWTRVCFTVMTYAAMLEFTPLRQMKWYVRYLHLVLSFVVTAPLFFLESHLQNLNPNLAHAIQYDNPKVIFPMAILFVMVAAIMVRYRRPWTEIYLFTLSFQIYNFFIDPFTWYAGSWILLHVFVYLFYTKAKFSDDWLVHPQVNSG